MGTIALVFGAVLLLFAFIGGGGKLLGVDMPAMGGTAHRAISALLGIALIGVAFFGGSSSSAEDNSPSARQEEPRGTQQAGSEAEKTRTARTPTPPASNEVMPLQVTVTNCVAVPGAMRVNPPTLAFKLASGTIIDVSFDDGHIYTRNESTGAQRTFDRENHPNRWIRLDGEERLAYCADSMGRFYIAPQP